MDTETEAPEATLPNEQPKPKQRRGFAAMNPATHRELARAGGIAAHAHGLAHQFTPEQAREAGKKGGAKTAANREHMAEIGRKGGIAKKGYRANRSTEKEIPENEKPVIPWPIPKQRHSTETQYRDTAQS